MHTVVQLDIHLIQLNIGSTAAWYERKLSEQVTKNDTLLFARTHLQRVYQLVRNAAC